MEQQDLLRMALAFALTKVKLRRSYRLPNIWDFSLLVQTASCDANWDKACLASEPQEPYVSTTMGMQCHPNSEHFTSLSEGLSGDVTETLKAAEKTSIPISHQYVSRT